jgi:hypothetical protein
MAKRLQVYALDLVQSLAWAYPDMVDGSVPAKSRAVLLRLGRRRANIMDLVVHVPYVGKMSTTRQKQYQRVIDRTKLVLDHHFASDEIDGSAYLNAILALVEDIYFQIPAHKKNLKREWDYLRGSMATLYGHHDPDMTSPLADKGIQIAADLMKAVEDRLPYGYGKKKPQIRIVRKAS